MAKERLLGTRFPSRNRRVLAPTSRCWHPFWRSGIKVGSPADFTPHNTRRDAKRYRRTSTTARKLRHRPPSCRKGCGPRFKKWSGKGRRLSSPSSVNGQSQGELDGLSSSSTVGYLSYTISLSLRARSTSGAIRHSLFRYLYCPRWHSTKIPTTSTSLTTHSIATALSISTWRILTMRGSVFR